MIQSDEDEGLSIDDVNELMEAEEENFPTVYDQALNVLSTQRAVFGAMQARLTKSMEFLDEDSYDKSRAGSETNKNSTVKSETQGVSPYLGYVLSDYFNLGIMATFENSRTEQTHTSRDDGSQIHLTEEKSTNSASIFTRFLFAGFMYFELKLAQPGENKIVRG